MRWRTQTWGLSLVLLLAVSVYGLKAAQTAGFDLKNPLVPAALIVSGGPPKDGIPAIDAPVFIPAAKAGFLAPGDRVLGMEINGIAKAYPIGIMNWHEIVNDRFGQKPVVVTFCPLCGTGVAFDSRSEKGERTFGVSGLLYNSDVLLYDRQTESLWSQIMGQAVSGPEKGALLTRLPLSHTSWQNWRRSHPNTLVLSRQTGTLRDYDRNPYAGYESSRSVYFDVTHWDTRLHPKEQVLGLEAAGIYKAYPFSALDAAGGEVVDRFGGQSFRIVYSNKHRSVEAFDMAGKQVGIVGFWFAWAAFHPDTELFLAPDATNSR